MYLYICLIYRHIIIKIITLGIMLKMLAFSQEGGVMSRICYY